MKHELKRIERIKKIKEILEENPNEENYDELIAQLSFNWGASRRTILEYINIAKFLK